MFGAEYLLGYNQGRSSAESDRATDELVARVIYGQRPVTVDQSYLDQLKMLVEKFRADSDHNFDKAELFHREALEWKADAERHEANATALQARVAALEAQVAQYDAVLVQSHADHEKTNSEKHGLNYFRWIATRLIKAHIQGRHDWPEFVELRNIAAGISETILSGAPFSGYQDKPEEKARVRALVDALGRP